MDFCDKFLGDTWRVAMQLQGPGLAAKLNPHRQTRPRYQSFVQFLGGGDCKMFTA